MGNINVKVRISQVTIGPSPTETTTYRRGQEFTCSEEEATRLGNSVITIEKIIEPKVQPPIQNTVKK